jgi:hypothetical protein
VNSFESNEDFLAHLVQIHPPIVEGCSLADILLHADPDDYEVLKDLKVLSCVAQNLKDSGKIKAIT